jgi:hypothetical protein
MIQNKDTTNLFGWLNDVNNLDWDRTFKQEHLHTFALEVFLLVVSFFTIRWFFYVLSHKPKNRGRHTK